MSQSAAMQLVNMLGAQGNQASQMAQQLQKLEDSCKDFEAVFTTKLLEVMRKTVPQDGIINGGRAEEIFTGLMNEEIAKNIADTGQMGLADMMFSQLQQQLFGQGQITDPSFFQLGKELIKIEAENADPAAQDALMTELLEGGGDAGDGEGVDLTDMLAEAGVGAAGETADGEAAADETAGAADIPEPGRTPEAVPEHPAVDAPAPVMPEQADVAGDAPETAAAVQELSTGRAGKQDDTQQRVNTDAVSPAPETNGLPEAVNADTDDIRGTRHTRQPVDADADTDADVEAVKAGADTDAAETRETAVRKAAAADVPAVAAEVADDGEAPVTQAVRKDAADRYRRADGKDENRSFAARVSEHLRSSAAPQEADAADTAQGQQADTREAGADDADISLLKGEMEGKVENAKRTAGFAVPERTTERAAGEAGKTATELTAAGTESDTEANAAAFQRMQALGTALTETEHAEMTRTTVEEPAKVMNQIIRSAEVMVKEGRSEMTIELQPRHLGEVRINVVMDNDVLTARIHAKNEAVGDMIRLNLAQLGDSMKDMGFDVSHFDVSSGSDYGFGQDGGNHANERDGQPVFGDTVSEFLEGVEPEIPEPYQYRASAGQYAFDAVA